ncbi:TenA family protein [Planctomycetaceae bacterium SH139]
MLHESLWKQNADLASACLDHPFIRQLGAGTLEHEVFKNYVAQDAFFLKSFAKAYALALAKSTNLQQAQAFHALIAGVLEELKLHANYADKLKIDLSAVKPYRATSAYTNFLLAVAWQGELAEILAAMVPCMRLYAYLGTALQPALQSARPAVHPFEDWIQTYASKEFGELCIMLEKLLDVTASDTPVVRDAYRFAMQCELDFFAAPLEQPR